ncbi:MAG: hypothetical protein Q7R91_00100 [bacterium]|nr:hypothetical protein [bacterium]
MEQNAEINSEASKSSRIKKILLWTVAVVVGAFIALVIYRIPHAIEQQKTAEVVAKIHATKLTLDDVMGKNLPPEPDPAVKDATLEGVDANGNGIRDDVELAIFKLHPDSARIRAAELQYVKALQIELTTDVFNSETLVATVWEESRGYFCIDRAMPNVIDSVFYSTVEKVKAFVLNTESRKNKKEEILKKYMSSHANPSDKFCDIALNTLPN